MTSPYEYEDEEAIRARIEEKLEARSELITHAAFYVGINALLWAIWFATSMDFPWPVFVTGGWGIGMITHYFEYTNTHGTGAERREAMIQREMDRERERLGLAKAKNDDAYQDDSPFYDTGDDAQSAGRR